MMALLFSLKTLNHEHLVVLPQLHDHQLAKYLFIAYALFTIAHFFIDFYLFSSEFLESSKGNKYR